MFLFQTWVTKKDIVGINLAKDMKTVSGIEIKEPKTNKEIVDHFSDKKLSSFYSKNKVIFESFLTDLKKKNQNADASDETKKQFEALLGGAIYRKIMASSDLQKKYRQKFDSNADYLNNMAFYKRLEFAYEKGIASEMLAGVDLKGSISAANNRMDNNLKDIDRIRGTNYFQELSIELSQMIDRITQMTDKAKESQSPFMQNPDPNLVYAQGAGIARQLSDERDKATEMGEGFFINKKEKDKKKAA